MTELLMHFGNVALIPLTLALALVLALRNPLRRRCGAGAAYLLWCLPPLAVLAAVLPNGSPLSEVLLLASNPAGTSSGEAARLPPSADSLGGMLTAGWSIGTLVCLLFFFEGYRRFLSRIRPVRHESGDLYRALGAMPSPALVGLWRPRIVLPADFERQYDERQRRMIIEHERQHRARGDHWSNALAALVQCLFWFHPLVWWSQRAFRADQEMACDARVLRLLPDWPQSYARALVPGLRPQTAGICQWSTYATLTERIMMIKQAKHSQGKSTVGLLVVMALALTVAGTVWSNGTNPRGPDEKLYFTLNARIGSEGGSVHEHHFVIGTAAGRPGRMETTLENSEGKPESVEYELIYSRVEENLIDVSFEIIRDGASIATPRLVFPIDSPEGAMIQMMNADGSSRLVLDVRVSRERPVTD